MIVAGLANILHDFQRWFGLVAWALGRPENRGRHPFTRRVELRLAEYTRGDRTRADLLSLEASPR